MALLKYNWYISKFALYGITNTDGVNLNALYILVAQLVYI